MRVWVYREGFARFSAGQFSLDALQDVYIHLTNVAIQKTSEDYNPEKVHEKLYNLSTYFAFKTNQHFLTINNGCI